jgi:cytochrome c peroxidase
MHRFSVYLFACLILAACNKGKVEVFQDPMALEIPPHFPQPHYNFDGNELSEEKIELGRKLFYDEFLSRDNTVSCASCHHQAAAFSDPGQALSVGVEGRLGKRNSPPLFNLAWHPSFMWDGGINHIEIMPLAPLTDPQEMDITVPDLLQKLNSNLQYRYLFEKAFGVSTISDYELFLALAQFMGTMVSGYSKYDRYISGNVDFSSDEKDGLLLFRDHCATCHQEPLFTDFDFHNNGLDSVFLDNGRYLITLIQSDKGKFKTPSLRNIELTYPYMHDGRFSSLHEVLEHYQSGVQHSPTLSPLLEHGISLTNDDVEKIITFLLTLTDYAFINNPKYSSPD